MNDETKTVRSILQIDPEQYELLTRQLGFLLLASLTPEQIARYVHDTDPDNDSPEGEA